MSQVEPSAAFLSRYPAVEWVVILNENTNFYLTNFLTIVQQKKWNPHQDLIFVGKEISRLDIESIT